MRYDVVTFWRGVLGFMGSWVHGFTGTWVHGSWVHGYMGSRVHGFVAHGSANKGSETHGTVTQNAGTIHPFPERYVCMDHSDYVWFMGEREMVQAF